MNKEEFLNYLKNGTNDRAIMLDCCQYFVDCYPIFLLQVIQTPFGNIDTGRGIWTSLPDYKVKDDPIAMKYLDVNFNKLQLRVKELEDYDKE